MEVNTDNICSKKRKISSQDTLIELSDDECLDDSCEIIEPDTRTSTLGNYIPSQCSDSGIESLSYNSQNSEILSHVSTTNGVEKRLLELEDQLQALKAENEALKLKSCHCEQTQDNAIITINFNSLDNFKFYKNDFIRIFDSYVNLEVKECESNLLLSISKDDTINSCEWVIVDEVDCITPHDKHKKKKKKRSPCTSNESVDIFMVDTTPSLSTKNNLQYERKFDLDTTADKDGKKLPAPKTNANVCFNCEGDHHLKDCTEPKNYSKINALRQKQKTQNKGIAYKRYHLEDDQRFGHLQPGKITRKLKDALGLRTNQLPEYIYRMRQYGYPPGWYNEITSSQDSSLVLFDFDGRSLSKQKKHVQHVDINRVIDYHGFNVPLEKGYTDEYRQYGCSPYSKQSNKQKMIDHLLTLKKEKEDNLELCDMEIDNNPSDKELEDIASSGQNGNHAVENISPTLVELETEKQKLLAELTKDVNNSQTESKDTSSSAEVFVTIDTTGTVDELNDTPCNLDANTTREVSPGVETPKVNVIKASSYGTPILKSASLYSRLPDYENFTKNVSDIINFENLPNSTGKYDQMVGVIEKVRTTLKNLNDKLL
ncbi:hypothetical protein RN001_011573 [Aquatica leii]|uniref:PSP proline-rich domain-containing protein n=1 Tax=Aquatica leii TaxID=1421715 RepID=A0AAN7P5X3_9COLE|nr:hypothetical protein RN001_011573 [Aquatica leii]